MAKDDKAEASPADEERRLEKDDETEASPAEQELRLPDIELDDRRFQDLGDVPAARATFHDQDEPMA